MAFFSFGRPSCYERSHGGWGHHHWGHPRRHGASPRYNLGRYYDTDDYISWCPPKRHHHATPFPRRHHRPHHHGHHHLGHFLSQLLGGSQEKQQECKTEAGCPRREAPAKQCPRKDVKEANDPWATTINMSGYRPENVSVKQTKDNKLLIKGCYEKAHPLFGTMEISLTRVVKIPDDVDPSTVRILFTESQKLVVTGSRKETKVPHELPITKDQADEESTDPIKPHANAIYSEESGELEAEVIPAEILTDPTRPNASTSATTQSDVETKEIPAEIVTYPTRPNTTDNSTTENDDHKSGETEREPKECCAVDPEQTCIMVLLDPKQKEDAGHKDVQKCENCDCAEEFPCQEQGEKSMSDCSLDNQGHVSTDETAITSSDETSSEVMDEQPKDGSTSSEETNEQPEDGSTNYELSQTKEGSTSTDIDPGKQGESTDTWLNSFFGVGGATAAADGPIVEDEDGKKNFLVKFNLSEYKPEHIKIKISGATLKVDAVREEEVDDHVMYSEFHRTLKIPDGVDTSLLKSRLGVDGFLTVTAPVLVQKEGGEREIPVMQ